MFKSKIYLRELGAGLALYLLLLWATIFAVHRWPLAGGARIAVLLLPMAGVAAVAAAVLRGLWRMDELQRRIQLDAIAVAFLATAVATLGWGFAALGGAPAMPAFAVWPMMATFWIAGLVVARRRYR